MPVLRLNHRESPALAIALWATGFLAQLTLSANAIAAAPADLVVSHARIATEDAGHRVAEALAVRDGKISAWRDYTNPVYATTLLNS